MQRKPTAQTRGPNAAEKRYMAWLHSGIPCAACGTRAATIAHHMEGSAWKRKVEGVTVLLGHWAVIGLCGNCDTVVTHGSRRTFRLDYGPQREMWRRQIVTYPEFDECPSEVFIGILGSSS